MRIEDQVATNGKRSRTVGQEGTRVERKQGEKAKEKLSNGYLGCVYNCLWGRYPLQIPTKASKERNFPKSESTGSAVVLW